MTPSTALFDLIKSLSKSEKRFFKLSASLQSGNKNYMRLFDAIEQQDEYDEEAIKSQFEGEKFIKHLPSEKNYLYSIILKSLRGFYSDNSVGSILKQEIKNIEILYNKALFKSCRKTLKKAKKKAIDYEKFYYWFELISWEKKLIEEEYEQGIFQHNLKALVEEELEVIEKLRNLAEYQMLFSQINAIFRTGLFSDKTGDDLLTVQEIANHYLIKGKNTALSRRAATICYYIQGVCSAVERDYKTALPKFERTLEILEENPKIKVELAGRYVNVLKNLIYSNIDRGNLEEAQVLVDKMKQLSGTKGFDSMDITLKIFTFSSNTQIIILDHKGLFFDALPVIEEMQKGLVYYENKINKEQRVLFYYNIAYIYFGIGEYRKALKWINEIVNDNEANLRQDIYGYAEILNLMIHYELGNKDYIVTSKKVVNRQLKKKLKHLTIELEVVNKIVSMANKYKKEKLLALQQLLDNKESRVLQDYFDMKSWVVSKLTQTPFYEVVKNKF